jgi:hypothetical protein
MAQVVGVELLEPPAMGLLVSPIREMVVMVPAQRHIAV